MPMKKASSDIAYEYIRRKILGGAFPPGYALMTEVLSVEAKVSRTPVREALHKLKAEGLVSISPRLGASVKKMDPKEFREACGLRLALEGYSAALAATNHSPADLRQIKYALDAMRVLTAKILAAADEAPFINDLLREDVHFHVAIMTAANNDLMKAEILRLNMSGRLMVGPRAAKFVAKRKSDANRRRVLASHEEIYAAIIRGDAGAARAAMERHIQDIVDKTMRQIGGSEVATSRPLSEEELAYVG
jgi:DNA-binding GntR family transcriptional regulator